LFSADEAVKVGLADGFFELPSHPAASTHNTNIKANQIRSNSTKANLT
jgi:hypothetical protein